MYQERRKRFAESLPKDAIAILFSGNAPYKIGDEKYPFSVDRSFYYLTGLDRENMTLILVKRNNNLSEYLFIERYDEDLAKWVGGRIPPQDASYTSGIMNVYWKDETLEILHSLISYNFSTFSNVEIYFDYTRQEANQENRQPQIFTKKIRDIYPSLRFHDCSPQLALLRMIKEEDEIAKLKEAIYVTKEAIENMMTHTHNGICEYELEAYFDFVLKRHNCDHSFPSIIAGGQNATILHYLDNDHKIKNNALVLCDCGASHKYLNADITRTFPVNGKFSKRQKQIYNIVLDANKYIMSIIKPGVTLAQLNGALIDFYQDKLSQIGLLKRGKTVEDYYWHGVSHMLGLETHDVSLANYPVRVGNVFTVEPGLYLEDEGIGVRIEDDILVTEDGCICLSKDIIKEVDEIEAFMAEHNKAIRNE